MRGCNRTFQRRSLDFDHPMFDDRPLSPREAWLWLISNAAFRPVQVMVRNGRSQQLVSLERGQLTYSRSFLRVAWRWTSDKAVRTFLSSPQERGNGGPSNGPASNRHYYLQLRDFSERRPAIGAIKRAGNRPAKGQQRARRRKHYKH